LRLSGDGGEVGVVVLPELMKLIFVLGVARVIFAVRDDDGADAVGLPAAFASRAIALFRPSRLKRMAVDPFCTGFFSETGCLAVLTDFAVHADEIAIHRGFHSAVISFAIAECGVSPAILSGQELGYALESLPTGSTSGTIERLASLGSIGQGNFRSRA